MRVINNSVIHFEDEGQVGLVLDYKLAAIVMWLLGECSGPPTSALFMALDKIKQVETHYETIKNISFPAPQFKKWYEK